MRKEEIIEELQKHDQFAELPIRIGKRVSDGYHRNLTVSLQ